MRRAMLVAAACLGVVAGAMLQAATGFGFSLVAAPLLFAAIEPEPAVVLLLVLGLEVNLLTLGTERRRPRPLRRSTVLMLACALPGALAGVAVLRALPAEALQIAVTLGVARHARRAAGDERARARVARPGSRRARSRPRRRPTGRRCCCTCSAAASTPEQVRDTLTVVLHRAGRDRRGRAVRHRRSGAAGRHAHARARARRARRPPRRTARFRATGAERSLRACLDRGADRRRSGRPHRRAPLDPLGLRREWRSRTGTGSQPSTPRSWRRSGRTATCTSGRC